MTPIYRQRLEALLKRFEGRAVINVDGVTDPYTEALVRVNARLALDALALREALDQLADE